MNKKIVYKLAMSILWLFLIGLAGCGSSTDANQLPVFPVKGQLAIRGKPATGAFVVLHPMAALDSKVIPPRGQVRDDGTFSLTTYKSDDGAPVGEYKVTVEYRELVKQTNGDISRGPNLVPKQYGNPKTSPLTVRIAEGENALPPIVLK